MPTDDMSDARDEGPRARRDEGEVERLLALAKSARRAARDGDFAELASIYEVVRDAANTSRGSARALYEVAEGFLKALSREGYSRDSLALLRFISAGGAPAADLIAGAASLRGIGREGIDLLPDPVRQATADLIATGVLLIERGILTVRPGLRPVARDLVEPPMLRMWKHVHTQRQRLALSGALPTGQRVTALAAMLGVTEAQAAAHLHDFPIQMATATAEGTRARVPAHQTLYKRSAARRGVVTKLAESHDQWAAAPMRVSATATDAGADAAEKTIATATATRAVLNELAAN